MNFIIILTSIHARQIGPFLFLEEESMVLHLYEPASLTQPSVP